MIEAFGAFEGGGAKGLAHVGALKAAEQRNVVFKGVAGTSAGAIVASLYAAGWKPDELFGKDDQGRVDGILNLAPQDLVDAATWREFSNLKQDAERLFRSRAVKGFKTALLWWNVNKAFFCHRKILRRIARELGAFDTGQFETWLNQQLAAKVFGPGAQSDGTVFFRDLPIPLKVVAADIDASRLICLDRESTPATPVARAVSLSISIPFVFKPSSPSEEIGRCVDGGIVSNLPVWAFDSEREPGDPLIPTFGFRLDDPVEEEDGREANDFPDFVKRVLKTALFGSSPLEERGITSLHTAQLLTSVDAFNFGVTFDERRTAYNDGLQDALRFFKNEIGPADRSDVTMTLQGFARGLKEKIQAHFSSSTPSVRVRMAVMLPDREMRRLRVMYTANMEGDADDRLELPIDCPGAGTAFAERNPVYTAWEDAKEDFPSIGIDKYILCKVPNDLKSIYSVPIFSQHELAWNEDDPSRRPQPLGVLNVDFDHAIQDFCEAKVGDELMVTCANWIAKTLTK